VVVSVPVVVSALFLLPMVVSMVVTGVITGLPVVLVPVFDGPVVVVFVTDLVTVHVSVGGGVELGLEVLYGVTETGYVGTDGCVWGGEGRGAKRRVEDG